MSTPITNFSELNIPSFLLEKLKNMNFLSPTAIQSQSIPEILNGKDILASSQTGSGKTAAFAIPIITQIFSNTETNALILCPTRELAIQIRDVFHEMRGREKILTATLFGGSSIDTQTVALKKNPRVVIATPGRLQDHIKRRNINLATFNVLVLDEFDRMLDMGFRDDISNIVQHLPKQRQTLMFSATKRGSVITLAKSYLHNFVEVTIDQPKESHENIEQKFIEVSENSKYEKLLEEITQREGAVLVFANMKYVTDVLAQDLRRDGIEAHSIHGDLRQSKRESIVKRFREKKFKVLIATDVIARGIDIPLIQHVINYDTPRTFEDYTHRIGRTGRGGAQGHSICFVTRSEKTFHQNILKKIDSDSSEPQFRSKSQNSRIHRGRPSFSRNDRNPSAGGGDRGRRGGGNYGGGDRSYARGADRGGDRAPSDRGNDRNPNERGGDRSNSDRGGDRGNNRSYDRSSDRGGIREDRRFAPKKRFGGNTGNRRRDS